MEWIWNNKEWLLSGIGVVIITSIFALVRHFMQKNKPEKIAEQTQVMHKDNVDNRFNNAVRHLGNENPAVVLGGVHALHLIAVENENYRQVIHNLFCSYLRENSDKHYKDFDFENIPDYCPIIIQILIDYLFKSYNGKDNKTYNQPIIWVWGHLAWKSACCVPLVFAMRRLFDLNPVRHCPLAAFCCYFLSCWNAVC